MLERMFSQDAYLNYIAEFFGIIITVILIPVFIYFNDRIKNRHKKLLAENILMSKLNNHLEQLVPVDFRDENSGLFYADKRFLRLDIVSLSYILPFSIKQNVAEEIENYFINSFITTKKKIDLYNKIYCELINSRDDLQNFFLLYSDVLNRKLLREFYIMDFNIHSCDQEFRDDDTVESFAESVKIVIYCLDDMRKLLVRRHKEINDFKIKLLEEQNA
ncbi:MAG: hypothetical protein VB066_10105 [Paludibacter sp.]|nr:hypothetical protein [Paludibacter sp.]